MRNLLIIQTRNKNKQNLLSILIVNVIIVNHPKDKTVGDLFKTYFTPRFDYYDFLLATPERKRINKIRKIVRMITIYTTQQFPLLLSTIYYIATIRSTSIANTSYNYYLTTT